MSAIISVDSEYNDYTYDNTVVYAGIYDSQGHEIYPTPGQERQARKELKQVIEQGDFIKRESNDTVDEVVVRLATPDLYVAVQ